MFKKTNRRQLLFFITSASLCLFIAISVCYAQTSPDMPNSGYDIGKILGNNILDAVAGQGFDTGKTLGDNLLDHITDQYVASAASWTAPLQTMALQIFWTLAILDFVWGGMELIFTKGDLGDWLYKLSKQILVIGFFYAALTHSAEWAGFIIKFFQLAGDKASGMHGLMPSNIFDSGVTVAANLIKAINPWHPVDMFTMICCGILLAMSFVLMGALQVVTLVESFIYIYAGIIFFGFGGSRFTRDIVNSVFHAIVAVGAKLFVIQLVIGVALRYSYEWQGLAAKGDLGIFGSVQIMGGSIAFLALVKMIPDVVFAFLKGASASNHSTSMSSFMAGMHTGAAVANAAGAVATGGLGLASGLAGNATNGIFGENPIGDGLKNASGGLIDMSKGMGNSAASHANDAFTQGMGTSSGSFYGNPVPAAPGTARGDEAFQNYKNSIRGDGNGNENN